MKKTIISVEYWFDGSMSCSQVTKQEYYNYYLSGMPKFRRVVFSDGTEKYINE